MTVLLDAHALIWFGADHPNLSAAAREQMADEGTDLALSVGTVWEIAIKVSLGKLTLAEPYEPFMQRLVGDYGIQLLPITVKHGAVLTTLPFRHRDPFDRLLVAQAIVEALLIVSRDSRLDTYGVTRIW